MANKTPHSTLPSVDELLRLAKENPEELERIRQAEIEALINSAPPEHQRRLKGLQFQIDCERQLHDTPMGACIAISRMMFESVNELQKSLNTFQSGEFGAADFVKEKAPKATVLSFNRSECCIEA